MYTPNHFNETNIETMLQLIQAYPLGGLINVEQDGINANHIPFELLAPTEDAPFGTLRAHVARANPVWKSSHSQLDALVIFQGPQAYITPSWYEEKKQTGKVVPTYNYAVVHARGRMRVMDNPQWLLQHLQNLTDHQESRQAAAWKLSDAPADYIQKLLNAIVGIEIPVTALHGKWKVSQNRTEQDHSNIAAGLRLRQDHSDSAMASLVEQQNSIAA